MRSDSLRRPLRSACMHRSFMRDLLRFGAMLRTAGVQLPWAALFACLSTLHVLVNLIVGFSFETALIVIQVRLLRSCILLGLRMRRLLLCHWALSFISFLVRWCLSYHQQGS